MVKMDSVATVGTLLKHDRRSFAEELGIDAESNTPSALFCLLVSALLCSARIGHRIALASARILIERGWTTAKKMAATRWEQRVQALDDGGYVRYDERTSTLLGESAQMLLDRYGGDLRKLREAAGLDPAVERRLLKEFKGVGEVGADIFFREAQLAWRELFPFADGRVLAAAKDLGLPENPAQLAGLVKGRKEFVRLVDALIRVQLEHRQEEVRNALAVAAGHSGALEHKGRRRTGDG